MNLFKDDFTRQIDFYCDAFVKRVFPAFDSIADEADEFANKTYKNIGQMPWNGGIDMADAAEYALEEGIEHYQALEGVRQSVINISLAGLSHLLEQQMLFFHRKQVLDPWEENVQSLICMKSFEERLKLRDIDIRELPSWSLIYELRQIANVVKHAEGHSSNSLRSIRPDLFSHPEFSEDDSLFWSASLPIYIPLAGQDLYPKSNEIEKFRKAALSFWDELLERYFQ